MNHAILLQKIIAKFICGNMSCIMGRLIVNFNRNALCTILQNKIRKSRILINIVKWILRVQIPRFFPHRRYPQTIR